MTTRLLTVSLLGLLAAGPARAEVASGPKPGEKVAPLKVHAVTGDSNTTAKGITPAKSPAGSCTLSVAAANFWTYSCPGGKTGMSKGAIPTSCKATLATGYLWMFSCPSSAFRGSSTTVKAGSKAQAGTTADQPRGCAGTLSDRRLAGLLCIL